MLAQTRYGKGARALITEDAALGGKVLAEDEEAFAAAVRALRPLRHEASYLELLDKPIDSQTVERFSELADHMARRNREVGARLKGVVGALRQLEGSTLGEVLQAGAAEAKG